jgi:hypothetical protein
LGQQDHVVVELVALLDGPLGAARGYEPEPARTRGKAANFSPEGCPLWHAQTFR